MFKTALCSRGSRPAFARRVYRRSARKWVLRVPHRGLRPRFPISAASKPEQVEPAPAAPTQLDFFGIANATLIYQIKPKFSRRKKKRRRHKGLQYKMQLKVRETERKLAFRSKAPKEHLLRNEDEWSDGGIRRLHYVLLVGSFITLRDHAQVDSVRAAEIWTWINRKGFDDFSFDACVAIAGELSIDPNFRNPFPEVDIDFAGADPDALRNMAAYLVRRNFGDLPPHAGLLRRGIRAAESGDSDAIEWCLADAGDTTEVVDQLSFVSCCDALGFEPEDVRRLIAMPAVNPQSGSRSRAA